MGRTRGFTITRARPCRRVRVAEEALGVGGDGRVAGRGGGTRVRGVAETQRARERGDERDGRRDGASDA